MAPVNDIEIDRIRQRYDRRKGIPVERYSYSQPDVLYNMQSVDRAAMRLLRRAGLADFSTLRILEVGCGSGANLLRFLRWGADPARMVGNELLAQRAERARRVLPSALEVRVGDARQLTGEPFDIVHQSTVFSSILDDDVQDDLAQAMWRLTKPGGAVLSYDFTFDNPSNPDVRKVTVARLRELFPAGKITTRRVTLAPPLARQIARFGPAYAVLEAVPALRTHVLATIEKAR